VEEEAAASANASVVATENLTPKTPDLRLNSERPSAEATAVAPQAEATVKPEATAQTETLAPQTVSAQEASPVAAAETVARETTVAPVASNAEVVSDKRQRVSVAATTPTTPRPLADDGARRAEKLRRASNVVLDEAAADPSLRFVLVATALIIISIVLLLLARVL
jgi:hypothetical protein